MARGKHYSLYKRNNIYYAQFKLSDGKWSTAKSTGLKTNQKLKHGVSIIFNVVESFSKKTSH